jgi:hypothetical protein
VANRLSALGVTDAGTISTLAQLPGAGLLSNARLLSLAEAEVAGVQTSGGANVAGRTAQAGLAVGVVAAITVAEFSEERDPLQCRDIGAWITDPNYPNYSLNAQSYQDLISGPGHSGENFRVSVTSGVSPTMKVDFDGCVDTSQGAELLEAKARYGSLLAPKSSNWSRAPQAVIGQGWRQIGAVTELMESHPGNTISIKWYTQTASDQGYIMDIFFKAGSGPINIPVVHLPGEQ